MKRLILASLSVLALLSQPVLAKQWDSHAGAYHVHLITVDTGFDLHIHSAKDHSAVDTATGKVTVRMLENGKPQTVPLTVRQKGILAGAKQLTGAWTMLLSINLPGNKPAQLRFSSKMKPGNQDEAEHEHQDGDDHAKPAAKKH
ncbi:MAG: hypothetical protein R3F58_17815 [Steroidobacteraceae bacterium]